MLNVFIVNPVAGGGKNVAQLIADVDAYFESKRKDYRIEYTDRVGDGIKIAKKYVQSGESVRLFACGGDGTLHEVINGVVGYPNVEVGVIPCGTGNDYCATFGKKEDFMDIEGQVKGSSIPVDIIDCDGVYSINQCSIGFDALVASKMAEIRDKPIIGGKMAYVSGLLIAFLGKLGNRLTVRIDDKEEFSGEFLFTIAAKGKYHGGGFKSAPLSEPSSGKLNFMLVKKVGHLRFLSLLPLYIKGKHLKVEDVVINDYGERLMVRSRKPLPITLDGEIVYSEEFCAKIVKSAVKFVIPSTIVSKTEAKQKLLEYRR